MSKKILAIEDFCTKGWASLSKNKKVYNIYVFSLENFCFSYAFQIWNLYVYVLKIPSFKRTLFCHSSQGSTSSGAQQSSHQFSKLE